MADRRKTRITFSTKEMKESLRQSRAAVASFTEISNYEDSDEGMRKKWMEVYNENIMNREEINRRKYSENDWRQLLLLQDVKGNLLLHHACRRRAAPETIRWLKGDDNDSVTLSHKSHDGSLPIHVACRAIAPFSVVKLVMEDSDGGKYLNVRDGDGHLSLDLLGKPEGAGKRVAKDALRLDANPMFDSFAEDIFEYLINDTTSDKEDIFQCMDSLCNISPAKKFQTIVGSNLRSKTNIEWLTWAFCQPNVILYIMRDFYCQLIWIIMIFYGSHVYLQGRKNEYVLYTLYAMALIFSVREIRQIRRYVKANIFIAYIKDPWNWLDCATIFLVTASAITLQVSDPNDNPHAYWTRRLLMITGACQGTTLRHLLRSLCSLMHVLNYRFDISCTLCVLSTESFPAICDFRWWNCKGRNQKEFITSFLFQNTMMCPSFVSLLHIRCSRRYYHSLYALGCYCWLLRSCTTSKTSTVPTSSENFHTRICGCHFSRSF